MKSRMTSRGVMFRSAPMRSYSMRMNRARSSVVILRG